MIVHEASMFDVDGEIWWRGGVGGEDSPISPSMLLSCFQEFCFLPIKKSMANFSGQITWFFFAAGL